MGWEHLAEANIQAWLQRPAADRAASPVAPEPPKPLELDLLDRVASALEEAARAEDPTRATQAATRARDAETQLFALLDATGRSILAPVFAERIAKLRGRT